MPSTWLPQARGTGVADRLVDELVGERDATLWVVEGNARARAFYARRGFVDEGGRRLHDGDGHARDPDDPPRRADPLTPTAAPVPSHLGGAGAGRQCDAHRRERSDT